MIKCPGCLQEIDRFDYKEKLVRTGIAEMQGTHMHEEMSERDIYYTEEYSCPKCGKLITTDRTNAINILLGE